MGGRRTGIPNKKTKLFIPTNNIEGLCSTKEFDPNLWWNDYPDSETGGRATNAIINKSIHDSRIALNICDRCPSKSKCLAEGMRPENIEWGIWGGLTAGERLAKAGMVRGNHARQHKVSHSLKIRAGMK